DRLQALRIDVRVALVEVALLDEIAHDAHRLHERLGIVEDRLVMQTEKLPGCVAIRRVYLDRLHLVRELEVAVGRPALDVRGPRNQRVAVPEADGLAVPARNFGTQMRDGTALVE